MADGSVPLLGLLERLYGGGQQQAQPPLASMPAFGGGQSDVYINPVTGDPMSPQMVAKQAGMLKGFGQGLAQLVQAPGATMQPNPYQPGTEQHLQFEHDRAQTMSDYAPSIAALAVGAGTPFAEEGALGVAGGRLSNFSDLVAGKAKPSFDPVGKADWIWQAAKGKQKAALDLLEQQKQRQFMRWTPDEIAQGLHGGETPEQWAQTEAALRAQFDKPFVSHAQLDRISEHAQDLMDTKGAVTHADLKAKFPKIDDATLQNVMDRYTR